MTELDTTVAGMMIDLAKRLADQSITCSEAASHEIDARNFSRAWDLLGQGKGLKNAADQVLLIARNL